MAQSGFVFRKGSSWFLKYRDNILVDGSLVRKQRVVFLAKYDSDRYRREADLDDLVQEKLADVRAADRCPKSSTSFVEYVDTVYLPFVERTMKPSTLACYRSYFLRYIKPHTKKYALRDFTIAIVSRLLEDVAAMHSLNTETVGKVRSILSGIFTYAMGKGNFPGKSAADNPASRALIPETATEPQETIAAIREDVIAILAHLGAQGMLLERAAVALASYTGCRPGEIRGLRWEEWDRSGAQIQVVRSVWHAKEGTPKTKKSVRLVAVTDELKAILLDLWYSQRCPIGGYILARAKGERVNLDNMAKRDIVPALSRCAVCQEPKSAEHEGHDFKRDDTLPVWPSWYALRRFHGTEVRKESNLETTSKALGNSKAVADKHYVKPIDVLPDVRKAVNQAMSGLIQ